VLFVTNPELTLFMLATIPILVISGFLFGRFIRKLSKQTQDALANANIVVEETLQAVSTVKTFTNELFEIARYKKFYLPRWFYFIYHFCPFRRDCISTLVWRKSC
jgi:ABC-type bacteriocin/lantibiotic exporter with double-glycine peptidase domain